MCIVVIGKTPSLEYRWVLRAGQRATIGRSPWAEFSIDDDDQLRDFHCQVRNADGQEISIEAVADADLAVDETWRPATNGSEELHVKIGQTQLILGRQRLSSKDRSSQDSLTRSVTEDKAANGPAWLTADSMRAIGLSDRACELIDLQKSPTSAVRVLVEAQLYEDAVRALAAGLGATQRLRWCSQLVEYAGQVPGDHTFGVVQAWLVKPQESLRQTIAAHVNWNHKHAPWTWLMASIGWTGGNLAGPSSIPVPPTDQMVITGVMTAINLVSAKQDVKRFQAHAIELGLNALREAS